MYKLQKIINILLCIIINYFNNNKKVIVMSFNVETPSNYEQKCCCVMVLDVSGSMSGDRINQLNQGLKEFQEEIKEDSTTKNRLEVAVVEFCDEVKTLVDPSLIDDFTMPVLTTKGTTALVDGVREGISIARNRKAWYKQTGQTYYRPWVILITDGAPDAGQDIDGLANEIQQAVANKDFVFFAVGVENADMNVLQRISDTSMPPAKLKGLKFAEFFKWLSASMGTITSSGEGATINLPSPADWMTGFKI